MIARIGEKKNVFIFSITLVPDIFKKPFKCVKFQFDDLPTFCQLQLRTTRRRKFHIGLQFVRVLVPKPHGVIVHYIRGIFPLYLSVSEKKKQINK